MLRIVRAVARTASAASTNVLVNTAVGGAAPPRTVAGVRVFSYASAPARFVAATCFSIPVHTATVVSGLLCTVKRAQSLRAASAKNRLASADGTKARAHTAADENASPRAQT